MEKSTFLIDFLSTESNIDIYAKWVSFFSNIATVVAVIVAIIAAVIAFKQLHSNIKESKSSTANSIYQQYLHLCMNHTNFSYGMQKPDTRNEEYAKYCWFVSSMLFSFEQILEINENDKKWEKAIESQLKMHVNHLKLSSTISSGQWKKSLEMIINKVINA